MLRSLGPMTGKRHQFHFRTRYRWMDGEFEAMNQRLIDVLNRDDLRKGLIANAFQSYGTLLPDEARESAVIQLENVLFAVPIEDPGTSTPGDPFNRIRKKPVQMEVGIGPYWLQGSVYLVEGSDPRDVLVLIESRFFVMSDVTLRHVDQPDVFEQHPIVLVNRGLIDYTLVIP